MNKTTVRYIGPGNQDDPREMKVSEREAADLAATGLWETADAEVADAEANTDTDKSEKADKKKGKS